MKTADNPEEPLTAASAQQMRQALDADRSAFFDQFTKDFFSAKGVLQVIEAQRARAIALCQQSAQPWALACMDSFCTTDFREDLKKVAVPTLVIHGKADPLVPYACGEDAARRIAGAQLIGIEGMGHDLPPAVVQHVLPALIEHLKSANPRPV